MGFQQILEQQVLKDIDWAIATVLLFDTDHTGETAWESVCELLKGYKAYSDDGLIVIEPFFMAIWDTYKY
jgi:hypothetical protein